MHTVWPETRRSALRAAFIACVVIAVMLGGSPLRAYAAAMDPAFGTAGIVRLPSPYGPQSVGAAQRARLGILGNGGLIYQTSPFSWQSPMQLQRLDVNGQPVGGPLSWPDVVNAPGFPMLRLQDGRTLIGGMRNNVARGGAVLSDAAVMRLDANGDPDPTFGNGGVVTIPLSAAQGRGGGDMVAAVATDEQGRILLAVSRYSYVNVEPDALSIVRLDANGRLESILADIIISQNFYVDGQNARLTPLYGGELRLDVDSQTWYFGADGRSRSAPTWRNAIFSYNTCICDGFIGWSLLGSVPNGDRVYAGIPTRMAISLDFVTPAGHPGSSGLGVEFEGIDNGQPLLARIEGNGLRFHVVAQSPKGATIVTALTTGMSQISRMLVFPDIASRRQVLDIGEQPDGSLIVTTQPSGSPQPDTGYAAFRIRQTGLPADGFVSIETPGLQLATATSSSSSSSASSPNSFSVSGATTSSTVASGGAGALDWCVLLVLLMVLIDTRPSYRRLGVLAHTETAMNKLRLPGLLALLTILSACGGSDSSVAVVQPARSPTVQPAASPWYAIGPSPPAIQAPVAVHAASRKMFVAMFGGGILESDPAFTLSPGGASPAGTFVRAVNNGLNALTTAALAIDPRDPLTLYAGTIGGGIFKTTNGGANWSITGETSNLTLFLAIDPGNSNTLYAGYNGAVPLRKSIDGGQTWVAASTGMPTTQIFTLAIDPNNSNNLYAGSTGNGAFRSTNGGASWTAMNVDSTIWSLAIDPLDSRVVYAGTNGNGVFRSIDSGANWQRMGSPGQGVVHALLKSGGRLIAGTAGDGVHLSDDNGATWQPTNLNNSMILSLSVDADGKLYAGTSKDAIRVSVDNGKTWLGHAVNSQIYGCNCQNGHALAVHPRDSGRLFFSTNDGGLFDLQIGGYLFYEVDWYDLFDDVDWYDSAPTLTTRSPRSIVVNPVRPDSIYVGSFTGGGFFKSDDNGRIWQRRLFGPPTLHVTGIAVTPDGATIYVTTLGGAGLWKSVDGGDNFQRIDVGTPAGPFLNLAGRGIAVDPGGGPNVYQAGASGVWRSLDRGATWSRVSTVSALTVNVHPVDHNVVLVGTLANGVLKSIDSGATFLAANNGLTQLRTGRTGGVLAHRLKPDTYYVNTEGGGVFKSKDAGASWYEINRGLDDLTGFGMAMDPRNPDFVYVATQRSVFRTTTGGE